MVVVPPTNLNVPKPYPPAPTATSCGCQSPLETTIWPNPPKLLPIKVDVLVVISCPPVIHTKPVVPLSYVMLKSFRSTPVPSITVVPPATVSVPCPFPKVSSDQVPTFTLPASQVPPDIVIWPGPVAPLSGSG